MKPIHLRFLGLALILSGLALLGLGTRKTITLIVDGNSRSLTTSAFTVGELLETAQIPLAAGDRLVPATHHWLKDGDVVRLDRAVPVYILADGKSHRLTNPEHMPGNLLALAGVPLYPGDQVLVNGRSVPADKPLAPAPAYSLQLRRAVQIILHDGSQTRSFFTTAATLGQALAGAGIEITAADQISPTLETPLGPLAQSKAPAQVTVDLKPARLVTVRLKDGQVQISTAAATVGEALAEAGLSLQGLDYSQPPASDPLPANGKIRLVRVQERVKLEQEPLPFDTEMQPAPNLELDKRKVIQAGEYGLTARRVRLRYEDGKEVSRLVEAEFVARQPKARIIGYGTKVVIHTLNTPNGSIQYWRAVPMYATSYSPCRIYTGRCSYSTYSGASLKKGVVALTRHWYTYYGGAQVYVPGYGVGTVADIGGGVAGHNWIDLGYGENDFVNWHQMVTVYFLTPVPDKIMYILP